MTEIYYPDGTVGISNPPISVINPGEEEEEKMRRPSSKHTLIFSLDGEPYQIKCGLLKMIPEAIMEKPTNVKDPDGKNVKKVTYVKATGDLLPTGTTGKKWINEDGKDIASAEVEYWSEDGKVKLVPYEKTDDVKLAKFLPRGTEDAYLKEKQFEIFPDDEQQIWAMWKLAKYLIDTDQIATGVIVTKKGWEKWGVIIIPYWNVESNKFSLISYFVREKFKLSKEFEIPKESKIPKEGEQLKSKVEELF